MGILPRATQVERMIPKAWLVKIPREWRPLALAQWRQRKLTQYRIWWKFEKHVNMQIWTIITIFFAVTFGIGLKAPLEHYAALPSNDPNSFLKDPYELRKISDKARREDEMRRRIEASGDAVGATIASYADTTQASAPSPVSVVSPRMVG